MGKFYLLQQREGQKPVLHIYQKHLAQRPDMKLIDAEEAKKHQTKLENGDVERMPGPSDPGITLNPDEKTIMKTSEIPEVDATQTIHDEDDEEVGAVIMDEELTEAEKAVKNMSPDERESYFATLDAERKFKEESKEEEEADPSQLVDFVKSLTLKNQLELFALSTFHKTVERRTVKEMQADCIELIEQRYQTNAGN